MCGTEMYSRNKERKDESGGFHNGVVEDASLL
jgi:hypothetical protein